jgi:hypothetical protein
MGTKDCVNCARGLTGLAAMLVVRGRNLSGSVRFTFTRAGGSSRERTGPQSRRSPRACAYSRPGSTARWSIGLSPAFPWASSTTRS